MKELLPIIPGCLCLIVKSKAGNTGTVTVIRELRPPCDAVDQGKFWETDRMMNTVSNYGYPLEPTNCIPESHLMRIDGGETLTETEDEPLEAKA